MRANRVEIYEGGHTVPAFDSPEGAGVPCARERNDYFLAASAFLIASADLAYLRWKRSTRPAVSSSFCFPGKKGWQLEQTSRRRRLPLKVERVLKVLPQAQATVMS